MKDTYYFSHDYNARADKKIKLLIRKLGMEGYGIYWSIIEDLYNNANALPLDYEGIAYDLRSDEKIVASVINDFGLFVIEEEEFGSLSVQRRLDKMAEKSRKARENANKRWVGNATAMPPHSKSNAIKENIIYKRKKNIINKRKETHDFLDEIVLLFAELFENEYKLPYISNGKDRSAVGKLLSSYKKSNPSSDAEQTKKDLHSFFNKCLRIEDKWLRDNMSLPLINSKINEIRIKLRGENATSKEIEFAVNQ